MGKHVSPLLGYNNNVRHKNRVFHIQTEDSGVKHPHIITHLFMDGGRILKSVKKSYAEHVGADGMQDVVKQLMKEQHKAMFIALRDGQFDHLLEAQAGTTAQLAAAAKAKAGDASEAKSGGEAGNLKPAAHDDRGKMDAAKAGAGRNAPDAVGAEAIVSGIVPPAAPAAAVSLREPRSLDDDEMVPMTTRTPELTLDMGALERAAASGASSVRSQNDLPPPPANMFREKTASGSYRSAPPPAMPDATATRKGASPAPSPSAKKPNMVVHDAATSSPDAGGAAKRGTGKASDNAPLEGATPEQGAKERDGKPPKASPSADNRYAAARPAAIFGQARPPQGSSIFGEDLISDKSLDEVILSYLAEDLEPVDAKPEAKAEKKK